MNRKKREDISNLIINTELNNKHRIKANLKKHLIEESNILRNSLSFLSYHALKYLIRRNVKSKKKIWSKTHEKKLNGIKAEKYNTGKDNNNLFLFSKKIIHNFSSYILSPMETRVLSYSFDHYVPSKQDDKKVQVEFERFFKSLSPHTTHLSEDEKTNLKTKFLNTWQNFSRIKVSSEEQGVIDNLAKNKDIVILKQDKGRGWCF